MELKRSSGILMHITSLPSPFGIGDLGPSAYDFIDFLKASGHSYWQLLPLNPTDEAYGHSPYSTFSAFAGNPLLISPELLESEGLLKPGQLRKPRGISQKKVNFKTVQDHKLQLLKTAYLNFQKIPATKKYEQFCKTHFYWLEDFSLYRALYHKYKKGWYSWPREVRDRDPEALKKEAAELEEAIAFEKFLQFVFFTQWEQLLRDAHRKKVRLIGDIPFYINHESADCWAHPECFKLNIKKQPSKLSGVPPDLFSEDGQLWGTPVYDWDYLKTQDFSWWISRLRQNLLLFDVVRLDHFRGFSAYWEVPSKEKTAKKGKWVKTPGVAFFEKVKEVFPEMPYIAEDLGSLDQDVYDLVEKFDFPGMKVLQFAFGKGMAENPYIPFNHVPHSIVYTGTHDNNTTRGWYQKLSKLEKRNLENYWPGVIIPETIHEELHRMALNSVSKISIVPLQDILGLGSNAKMNIPGTTGENWSWRAKPEEIPWDMADELKKLNSFYGRIPK